MDKKKAISIIDDMISEAGDGTSNELKDLRDRLILINAGYTQPLMKAIKDAEVILKKASAVNMTYMSEKGKENMKKVDPQTKLPGVMLDKMTTPDVGMGSMGSSGMNLTPGSQVAGIHKVAPSDAPPMQASEKHKELAQWMQKCMKSMHAKKSLVASSEPPPAQPVQKAGVTSTGNVPPPQKAPMGVKTNLNVRVGGMGMGTMGGGMGKSDVVRPDAGYGKVTVKVPPAQPTGKVIMKGNVKPMSSQSKDPVLNTAKYPQKPASEEYKAKSAAYLNKPKAQPAHQKIMDKLKSMITKKEDFPSKQADIPDDQKPKDMSKDGKRAVIEPKDQPIKISPERPGQANKPSPMGKLNKQEPLGKPYASDAQRRKFHAMENRGEISHSTVKEFDEASKGKKLPEKVSKK